MKRLSSLFCLVLVGLNAASSRADERKPLPQVVSSHIDGNYRLTLQKIRLLQTCGIGLRNDACAGQEREIYKKETELRVAARFAIELIESVETRRKLDQIWMNAISESSALYTKAQNLEHEILAEMDACENSAYGIEPDRHETEVLSCRLATRAEKMQSVFYVHIDRYKLETDGKIAALKARIAKIK